MLTKLLDMWRKDKNENGYYPPLFLSQAVLFQLQLQSTEVTLLSGSSSLDVPVSDVCKYAYTTVLCVMKQN